MLREESDLMVQELQMALEEERTATRSRLEAQKKQSVECLKAESEEELQAEKRRLQREQEEKLNSLKQEVPVTNQHSFSYLQWLKRSYIWHELRVGEESISFQTKTKVQILEIKHDMR